MSYQSRCWSRRRRCRCRCRRSCWFLLYAKRKIILYDQSKTRVIKPMLFNCFSLSLFRYSTAFGTHSHTHTSLFLFPSVFSSWFKRQLIIRFSSTLLPILSLLLFGLFSSWCARFHHHHHHHENWKLSLC